MITLGAALLVTVSLGPMTSELGTASPFVWLGIALVGGLQCLLLAALATRFPERAGGTAMYVHVVFGRRAPLLAAASSWGYWFAWTPGIAVNLILAATYLRASVWSGVEVLPLAVLIAGVLYAVNGLGLRISMRAAGLVALVAVIPLAVILGGALLQPSLVDLHRLGPVKVGSGSHGVGDELLLLSKWAFVAAWSAYGAEMASTVVAEMRDAERYASRALTVAAAVGLLAFGLVPFLMLALAGTGSLSSEPLVAFLPVAGAVLGDGGRTVVGIMLAGALILGAQAFVVGSSRTVYQMTRDGYMPRQLAVVNRRGVPVGSLALDATVIVVLLALFGTHVVDVVAAANVGYLVVFVLMPIAYLLMPREQRGGRAWRTALALALAAFNSVLLVVGGIQWGGTVMATGAIVMALIVPISILRRLQDRRAGCTRLLPFPAGEPAEDVA